jgi:hypothetical protein
MATVGCVLLVVTAGLALLLVPVAYLMGAFNAGTMMMAGALLSIAGGLLAMKGIMPYISLGGAALLIAGSVYFIPASGFGIIYVLVGLIMVGASLVMILIGYKDLLGRADARGATFGTR